MIRNGMAPNRYDRTRNGIEEPRQDLQWNRNALTDWQRNGKAKIPRRTESGRKEDNMKIDTNKYYIVRGDRSGVFFGRINYRYGQEVQMDDARCIWYWDGAASIMELSLSGTKKPNNCKFTVTVEEITITDAIEIISCTEKATAIIKAVKEWKA